jgi:hypothetical protein
MLGEQIYAGQGKRTGRRVVTVDPRFVIEVSFEDLGSMLGQQGMNIGTYVSSQRADGTLTGEGQGVFATLEGHSVTWKAVGTGRFGSGGAVGYRGALTFETISPALASLNGVAGAFEFDVDAAGNTQTTIWEWK